jgi:hypothetical protein
VISSENNACKNNVKFIAEIEFEHKRPLDHSKDDVRADI